MLKILDDFRSAEKNSASAAKFSRCWIFSTMLIFSAKQMKRCNVLSQMCVSNVHRLLRVHTRPTVTFKQLKISTSYFVKIFWYLNVSEQCRSVVTSTNLTNGPWRTSFHFTLTITCSNVNDQSTAPQKVSHECFFMYILAVSHNHIRKIPCPRWLEFPATRLMRYVY